MTKPYDIPQLPLPHDLETKAVLKQAIQANMRLAELKGSAKEIPSVSEFVPVLATHIRYSLDEIDYP